MCFIQSSEIDIFAYAVDMFIQIKHRNLNHRQRDARNKKGAAKTST